MTQEVSKLKLQLEKSIQKLKKAKQIIDDLRANVDEPIAIVGIGCRLPKNIKSPKQLWNDLMLRNDNISEATNDRWDVNKYFSEDKDAIGKMYTNKFGLIDDYACFDPDFFDISLIEAESMDPQQRLLLEVSWQALEDAGIPPTSLVNKDVAVFIGHVSNDYAFLLKDALGEKLASRFSITGNVPSIATGRLSYYMGLVGPNIAIDTACSSSLVAMHYACVSLNRHECDVAIAGGVNLIVSPDRCVGFSKMQMLASDGHCKTFDKSADGFVRGEGCGVVVLKRLSDAITQNDRIYAVIKATAVNQDGESAGITAPNGKSQEKLIARVLKKADVKSESIGFIETHGTGTKLGDPIEVNAILNTYGRNRNSTNPLFLGSIKTNVGHLEGAAGIAGLIKLALCIHYNKIPANLHFNELNPHITLDPSSIIIPTETREWSRHQDKPLTGATSSFGFSGTNAHAILQEAPAQQLEVKQSRNCECILISAKTEEALSQIIARLKACILDIKDLKLGNIAYTLNTGRSHFQYRLGFIADNITDLLQQFDAIDMINPNDHLCEPSADNVILCEFDDATNWHAYFTELVQIYLEGGTILWGSAYPSQYYSKISLPTYPFRRIRVWAKILDEYRTRKDGIISQEVEPVDILQAEDTLTTIKQLLKDSFGVDPNLSESTTFFEMGLDSIEIMEFRDQLIHTFGQASKIENTTLYQQSTCQKLADYLNSRRDTTKPSKPMEVGGWLVELKGNVQAQHSIVCFPPAGAGVYSYALWRGLLPEDIDLYIVQIPGRDDRTNEDFATDYSSIIDHLCLAISNTLTADFSFFGHSFGGLIAFDVCQKLSKNKSPLPDNLFISGTPPLDYLQENLARLQNILSLEAREMIEVFNRDFLLIKDPNQYETVSDMNNEVLKADLRLLCSRGDQKSIAIMSNIITISGEEDPLVQAVEMAKWREYSTGEYIHFGIKGTHFTILANPKECISEVVEKTKCVKSK